MRRVWASVMSVWALLALVAVLAWSRPPAPATQPATSTAVVRTVKGRQVVVLAPPAHATTQTSPGGATAPAPGGNAAFVSRAPSGGNG